MNNLIQSPLSIKDIQKQLKSIRLKVEELYLLGKDDRLSEKQGDILKSLKQVEVALEELFCKQLEYNYKRLLSEIDSVVVPLKLSTEFKELGLLIVEIVNGVILDGNRQDVKRMSIMVVGKVDDPYIDVMCDYGKGFDSTIVRDRAFLGAFGGVSRQGVLVMNVCSSDFGLKEDVEVRLVIY